MQVSIAKVRIVHLMTLCLGDCIPWLFNISLSFFKLVRSVVSKTKADEDFENNLTDSQKDTDILLGILLNYIQLGLT